MPRALGVKMPRSLGSWGHVIEKTDKIQHIVHGTGRKYEHSTGITVNSSKTDSNMHFFLFQGLYPGGTLLETVGNQSSDPFHLDLQRTHPNIHIFFVTNMAAIGNEREELVEGKGNDFPRHDLKTMLRAQGCSSKSIRVHR